MSSAEFQDYALLSRQAKSLIDGEANVVANLSNLSALIYNALDRVNWAGFYLLDTPDGLVLGPFQGQVACVRIPVGKGVCGTAVSTGEDQLVMDVHEFPGHIACDAASASEVVLPIRVREQIIGVLDIDSPEIARFSQADVDGLRMLVDVLQQHLEQHA
ncbi:GAF domain-containing protein [Ferrimonas pelagia]|uniref:GAF domain-containing protein n=1 Tax=Ferrimonas pelagia TaxID=1177826 RepID=A0ABP9F8C0_9GAMM